MHGGAIYALISNFTITKTCFNRCTSKDKQCLSLRGESQKSQMLNLTKINQNGRGSNDMITLSISTSVSIISNCNISNNKVEENSSGFYISTNFMSIFKYCSIINNIGSTTIEIQLRNFKSSHEYNNIINNTSLFSWTSVLIYNSPSTIGNFIFIMNSLPILKFDLSIGFFLIFKSLFDIPNENLFIGNITLLNSSFNLINPLTHQFSILSNINCKNHFNPNIIEKEIKYNIFLILILIIIIVIIFVKIFKPKKLKHSDQEERIKLKSNKWNNL